MLYKRLNDIYSESKNIKIPLFNSNFEKIDIENKCFDCGCRNPELISVNNGILICNKCGINHMAFPPGTSILINKESKMISEKELEFKKEQAKNDLEFKKEQADEEKKARKWDILAKIGIAIIPVIISSIFTVIVVKITCSENRKTLMATMLANEILERAGEISNVTAKDVAKEALKQATNVKIK